MKLENRTPFPTAFVTGSTGEEEMVGVLATKVTFRVRDGSLIPVLGEEAWPVFDKPFAFRGVALGPETDFRKEGLDVLVFGEARAPGGQPVTWLRVGVECGALRHQAVVFGDRRWVKEPFRFAPSAPAPFTSMPITNDRAFGGETRLGEAQVEHPANPEGRGFLYHEEEVEGAWLPNLEDEEALIRDWQDKPRPACFYKPLGLLEPRNLPPAPPEEVPQRTMSRVFNQAVPELVTAPEQLGEFFRLFGFSRDGDLRFPVPNRRGPTARVQVGPLRSRFPSRLSTVVLMADERALVATYLCLFRYLVRPMEERRVELDWPEGPRVHEATGSNGEGAHD